MGTYFFMSDELISHQRKAYNIIDILTSLGGICNVILTAVGIYGSFVND